MRVRAMRLCAFAFFCVAMVQGTANALTLIEANPVSTQALNTQIFQQGAEYYGGSGLGPLDTKRYVNFSLPGAIAPLGTITVAAKGVGGNVLPFYVGWVDSVGTLLPGGSEILANGGPLLFTLLDPGLYSLRFRLDPSSIGGAFTYSVTTTPIPPALILFGTALAGLTWLGRRRRRVNAAL